MLSSLDEEELGSLLTNVGVTFIDFNRFQLGSNYIQLIVDLQKAPEGFIERYHNPCGQPEVFLGRHASGQRRILSMSA